MSLLQDDTGVDRRRAVCEAVVSDMRADAEAAHALPFNPGNVATQFCNQAAAIASLAEVVATLLPRPAADGPSTLVGGAGTRRMVWFHIANAILDRRLPEPHRVTLVANLARATLCVDTVEQGRAWAEFLGCLSNESFFDGPLPSWYAHHADGPLGWYWHVLCGDRA